jgi:hypothetical protein
VGDPKIGRLPQTCRLLTNLLWHDHRAVLCPVWVDIFFKSDCCVSSQSQSGSSLAYLCWVKLRYFYADLASSFTDCRIHPSDYSCKCDDFLTITDHDISCLQYVFSSQQISKLFTIICCSHDNISYELTAIEAVHRLSCQIHKIIGPIDPITSWDCSSVIDHHPLIEVARLDCNPIKLDHTITCTSVSLYLYSSCSIWCCMERFTDIDMA